MPSSRGRTIDWIVRSDARGHCSTPAGCATHGCHGECLAAPAAPAPDAEFLRSELDRAWREVDFIAKERTEHLEWRTKLANDLDECERMRDVLVRTVNVLKAKGDMLAAVVQGAKEEFVRVPYGASHEDVAAINDWHRMADEALEEWK
jgi:hypothetical protein